MIVTFGETYLQELYEQGKSSDKKHRFQPEIVKRYQRCIKILTTENDIDGLRKYNSLNFEELQGDKKGISSIRVNDKYRIEFVHFETEEEPILTVCNIVELSNHYTR